MIIYFSADTNILEEWQSRVQIGSVSCDTLTDVLSWYEKDTTSIVVCDYDSVAHDINKLIASNQLFTNTVILERVPEISVGKMLLSHNVKAYGNSRMLKIHFAQLIDAVQNGSTWTYPELTAALVKRGNRIAISDDGRNMIINRLTPKEQEVLFEILDGLTNDAIANKLHITTRTVKAHISSIFEKLHVSDRVSLILLLK